MQSYELILKSLHNIYLLNIVVLGACEVYPNTYSTSEVILSKETVLITEFNLKCSGDYAQVVSEASI